MEDDCTDGGASKQKRNAEGVVHVIVGVFVAILDEVDSIGGGGEEEYFHDGVVEGEGGVPRLGE